MYCSLKSERIIALAYYITHEIAEENQNGTRTVDADYRVPDTFKLLIVLI